MTISRVQYLHLKELADDGAFFRRAQNAWDIYSKRTLREHLAGIIMTYDEGMTIVRHNRAAARTGGDEDGRKDPAKEWEGQVL